jgi:hypothetical protein
MSINVSYWHLWDMPPLTMNACFQG